MHGPVASIGMGLNLGLGGLDAGRGVRGEGECTGPRGCIGGTWQWGGVVWDSTGTRERCDGFGRFGRGGGRRVDRDG